MHAPGDDSPAVLSPKTYVRLDDKLSPSMAARHLQFHNNAHAFALEDIGMTRLTLALATWICLGSLASASLAPRKEPSLFNNGTPQVQAPRTAPDAVAQVAEGAARSEFVVTGQTEVLLNGKPCRYEEVPGHASIVRMEVAADKKTVLKIHFRTGK
jgi:hypothetical protein